MSCGVYFPVSLLHLTALTFLINETVAPCLHKLLKLFLAILVTTAERGFLALKHIKSYL